MDRMIIDLHLYGATVVELYGIAPFIISCRDHGYRWIEPGMVLDKMKVIPVAFGPFPFQAAGGLYPLVGAGADSEVIVHQIGVDAVEQTISAGGVVPGDVDIFLFRQTMGFPDVVVTDLISLIIAKTGQVTGSEHPVVQGIGGIEIILKTAEG